MISRRSIDSIVRSLALSAVLAVFAAPAQSQGVRVFGETLVRYIDVRGLRQVVVDAADLPGEGTIRQLPDGRWVQCVVTDSTCTYFETGDLQSTAPITQDLRASTWARGGIQAYGHVRLRSGLGSLDELWPQSDDTVDVISLYAQWRYRWLRTRGGRQFHRSTLGYFNFDGGLVDAAPWPWLRITAMGGWSLARGLNEPRTSDALSSVERFAPDQRAAVFGGQLTVQDRNRGSFRIEYLREIRTDRLALYSDRVGAAGNLRWRRFSLNGRAQRDIATDVWNELRGRLVTHLGSDWSAEVSARTSQPFFELWTIWNAFSPVGFDEYGGSIHYSPALQPVRISIDATRRSYDETNVGLTFAPIRNDGWHVGSNAWWRLSERWTVQAGYAADIGFGEARSEGNGRVAWSPNEKIDAGLTVQAFDYVREFRIAGSTVWGIGGDASWRVGTDTRLTLGYISYRHEEDPRLGAIDWNQSRAFARMQWALGKDPGVGRAP